MNQDRLRSCLFGLRKKPIDSFLRELQQNFARELDALRAEVKLNENEEIRLRDKVLELEEKALLRKNAHSFLCEIEKRLPTVLSWMDEKTAKELAEWNGRLEEDFAKYQMDLRKLEQEIQNGSQLLDAVIQQFTKGIENLNDFEKLLEFNIQEKAGQGKLEIQMPYLEINQQMAAPSSFWEGSERYLNATNLTKFRDFEGELPSVEKTDTSERKEELNQVAATEEPEEQSQTDSRNEGKERPTKKKKISADSGMTVQESEGMKREIDGIKKRYIVGKLSGIEINDSAGVPIIHKNEVITEEVLEKVSQEGTLADLIVHMKIPELGVSSDE